MDSRSSYIELISGYLGLKTIDVLRAFKKVMDKEKSIKIFKDSFL